MIKKHILSLHLVIKSVSLIKDFYESNIPLALSTSLNKVTAKLCKQNK